MTEGSELDVEHPEWMLYLTDENGKKNWTRMLNLANEDCLRWAIERVDSLICQGHVTIYRQDFNIHPPARYWATGDEPTAPEPRRTITFRTCLCSGTR